MAKQEKINKLLPPIPPSPEKDPFVEIGDGDRIGAIAMGLVYIAFVALAIVIATHL